MENCIDTHITHILLYMRNMVIMTSIVFFSFSSALSSSVSSESTMTVEGTMEMKKWDKVSILQPCICGKISISLYNITT